MTKRFLMLIASIAALVVVYFFVQSFKQLESDSTKITPSIMNTNGVLHIVALEDVLSGGPEKDEIPPLDNPQFIPISEASQTYADEDRGIAFASGNVYRFYPLRIISQHQVINDTIESKKILITYSPLSASAAAFDPLIQEEHVAFGNTGLLWDSNLVLYDIKTESEWSQILGKAIVGPLSGTSLQKLPCSIVTFGSWKKEHQDGQVLAIPQDTRLDYSRDPNQSYYESDTIYFPVLKKDTRLSAKTTILGISLHGAAKAYAIETVKKKGAISDSMNGEAYRIQYFPETDTIHAYHKNESAQNTELPLMQTYWFAWVGAYPDTFLYK